MPFWKSLKLMALYSLHISAVWFGFSQEFVRLLNKMERFSSTFFVPLVQKNSVFDFIRLSKSIEFKRTMIDCFDCIVVTQFVRWFCSLILLRLHIKLNLMNDPEWPYERSLTGVWDQCHRLGPHFAKINHSFLEIYFSKNK